MKKTVAELRQMKADAVAAMKAMLDAADAEKRDLTAEEETRYTALDAQADEADAGISAAEKADERRAKIDQRSAELAAPQKRLHAPAIIIPGQNDYDKEKEFKSIGEFLCTVAADRVDGRHDPRLKELRVQQMKDGTSGGYMVPMQFLPELLKVEGQEAVFRPRARVIEAGDPPDATIELPSLDQTDATQYAMQGGVRMYHSGESDQMTETSAALKKVSLTPKEITGYMTASNKLLRNWGAAGSILPTLMKEAMISQEEMDFYSGDGVNKALGILNAPAAINHNRATASQISFADVTGMLAKILMRGGRYVWVASQTCIPQLVNIRDTGNFNLWVTSAAAGLPNTLAGIPLIFHEGSAALGSKGDLALLNLDYYLIKNGSGPVVDVSEHFRFQNNETAFRIVWNVDGQPWLTKPLALKGATTSTVSPFVILDTP